MPENAFNETVWLDANRYYDAEARFYEVSVGESLRRANPGNPITANQTTDGGIGMDEIENSKEQFETLGKQIAKLSVEMNNLLARILAIENIIQAIVPPNNEIEGNDVGKVKEKLQTYVNKNTKKPAVVAKSSVVLDVKPWDDETDMKEVEKAVRSIETEGLLWGASKLVPLAYGINKFQIVAIVEDEKVSIDWLQEKISENDQLVQSVDIAAFNKL